MKQSSHHLIPTIDLRAVVLRAKLSTRQPISYIRIFEWMVVGIVAVFAIAFVIAMIWLCGFWLAIGALIYVVAKSS